jgi:hypothetical protein
VGDLVVVNGVTEQIIEVGYTQVPGTSSGGGVDLAGDLGNTTSDPQVLSTHLTVPLPVGQGGTGHSTWAPVQI